MSAGWLPGEGLVADLRHCLDAAPRDTREDRFEAWAWGAMLAETGPVALTRHGICPQCSQGAFVAPANFIGDFFKLCCCVGNGCIILLVLWLGRGGLDGESAGKKVVNFEVLPSDFSYIYVFFHHRKL